MLWFLLETSFCTGLRQDPFWEILASFWDVSGSSGKIERPLDGKKKGRRLEESMNGSGGGSCQEGGGGRMEIARGWREGCRMLIGWNAGPSKNGCCHRNQTWSLSGHFVGGERTGSGGVSVGRRDRNVRTVQTGAGWWWGSLGAGFVDSVLSESLILHQKFVKRRTDQHR